MIKKIDFRGNHYISYLPIEKGVILPQNSGEREDFTFNWPGDGRAANCSCLQFLDGEQVCGLSGNPKQKPEELINHLMKISSHRGETVFDGFMGVGTTAKVAKDLGRKFIGFELNEEYFLAAQGRVAAS